MCLQAAKREVRKFASSMVTSKEARAEIERTNEKEQMMQGEGHLLQRSLDFQNKELCPLNKFDFIES